MREWRRSPVASPARSTARHRRTDHRTEKGRIMLRPQDNARREARRLDGLWDFVVDTQGVGRDQGWWRGPLVNPTPMPVPSSYNDILVDPAVHDHVGDVWYQRTIFAPRGWDGQRIVLRFDAATHRASVWVDDTHVVSHEGGYTPFEADITELIA